MELHGIKLTSVTYKKDKQGYFFEGVITYLSKPVVAIKILIANNKIKQVETYPIGNEQERTEVVKTARILYQNITQEVSIQGVDRPNLEASVDMLLAYLYDIYSFEQLVTGFTGIEAENKRFFVYRLNKTKFFDPFEHRSIVDILPWKESAISIITLKEDMVLEDAIKRVCNREGVNKHEIVGYIMGRGKLPHNITTEDYYSIYL